MGLLDQYDKAKLYAKGLLGRVAQNYEDLQNSPQKIADLLSNVPSNAQSMYQGLLDAPAQVADLFSQQKAQQLAQALQKPQQANPQQWMDAGMELSGMAPVGGLMAHTVYHGSPHKFDKFDMSKIGTGEGAQAYGHGLYFAESPGVAKTYADTLGEEVLVKGKQVYKAHNNTMAGDAPISNAARNALQGSDWNLEKAKAAMQDAYKTSGDGYFKRAFDELNTLTDADITRKSGAMYKVDIPDEAIPRMLDWDRGLDQQSQEVRDVFMQMVPKPGTSMYYDDLLMSAPSKQGGYEYKAPLSRFYQGMGSGSHADLSQKLKQQGIPGIKYLDGMSRSDGTGTYNYVLFDDQLPRILEINGQPTGLLPWQEGEWLNLNRGLPGKMDNVPDMTYQIDHKPMSVKSGASTLNDLTKAFGNDIYGPNALRYFGSGDPAERRILRIMQQMKGKPDQMVTIYRGVPPDVNAINPGDWVTLDKDVASLYADPTAYGGTSPGKVLQMQVPAKHITSWPDSLLEFGYFPDK